MVHDVGKVLRKVFSQIIDDDANGRVESLIQRLQLQAAGNRVQAA